jgi:hypothetical protein
MRRLTPQPCTGGAHRSRVSTRYPVTDRCECRDDSPLIRLADHPSTPGNDREPVTIEPVVDMSDYSHVSSDSDCCQCLPGTSRPGHTRGAAVRTHLLSAAWHCLVTAEAAGFDSQSSLCWPGQRWRARGGRSKGGWHPRIRLSFRLVHVCSPRSGLRRFPAVTSG